MYRKIVAPLKQSVSIQFHQQYQAVTRSENGGVRKTIIVDLTTGRQPKWVARYEKWLGGGGGLL